PRALQPRHVRLVPRQAQRCPASAHEGRGSAFGERGLVPPWPALLDSDRDGLEIYHRVVTRAECDPPVFRARIFASAWVFSTGYSGPLTLPSPPRGGGEGRVRGRRRSDRWEIAKRLP